MLYSLVEEWRGCRAVLYSSASVRRDVFAQTGIILSVRLNQPNLSLTLRHGRNLDTGDWTTGGKAQQKPSRSSSPKDIKSKEAPIFTRGRFQWQSTCSDSVDLIVSLLSKVTPSLCCVRNPPLLKKSLPGSGSRPLSINKYQLTTITYDDSKIDISHM